MPNQSQDVWKLIWCHDVQHHSKYLIENKSNVPVGDESHISLKFHMKITKLVCW
jgi:hypothetical protein